MRQVMMSAVLLATLASPALAQQDCQGQKVTISDIVANEVIMGNVTDPSLRQGNEVVVYVHTNQWYIHPYAGQGEGMSFASIDPDGHWSLPTVKRQFKANRVAALVVPRGTALPDQTAMLAALKPKALCVVQLYDEARPPDQQHPYYGRL